MARTDTAPRTGLGTGLGPDAVRPGPAGGGSSPGGTGAGPAGAATGTLGRVTVSRHRRRRRWAAVVGILALLILLVFTASLVYGRTVYPLDEVVAVVLGEDVPGANFTVGTLRLPRAVLAVVAGACFGLGGVTFQTMLRNPLASPDIIGISAGASTAAAFAIIVLGLSGPVRSAFAIAAGLGVALCIYLLSYRGGVAGTRLILVGIGIAAMLTSVTDYLLSRAGAWDLAEALRWLTGSLNGTSWDQVLPVFISWVVLAPVLLVQTTNLGALQLGDDTAAGLGVRVDRTRLVVVLAAVGLVAFATAAAGPIAFVAFLSGPIAARLLGPNGSLLVPAMLVGCLLVLVADLAGQYAFGTRYPVGVITGVLGAPFLLYLIVRQHRAGAIS